MLTEGHPVWHSTCSGSSGCACTGDAVSMARVLAQQGRVGELKDTLLMKLLGATDPNTQASLIVLHGNSHLLQM